VGNSFGGKGGQKCGETETPGAKTEGGCKKKKFQAVVYAQHLFEPKSSINGKGAHIVKVITRSRRGLELLSVHSVNPVKLNRKKKNQQQKDRKVIGKSNLTEGKTGNG